MTKSHSELELNVLSIPHDIMLNHLFPIAHCFEKTQTMGMFARSCKYANRLFSPKLQTIQDAFKLTTAVLAGEKAQVKKCLDRQAEIMFIEVIATDLAGFKRKGSAFQAAIATLDVDMCELMATYFNHIPNAYTIAAQQIKLKMTAESKRVANERFVEFMNMLNLGKESVINILNDAFNNEDKLDEVDKVFTRVRLFIAESCRLAQTTSEGFHFDIRLFSYALNVYANLLIQRDDRPNSDFEKFWQLIIGYLQTFFPACLAQALCQGFGNLLNEQDLIRSLLLKDGQFYFLWEKKDENALIPGENCGIVDEGTKSTMCAISLAMFFANDFDNYVDNQNQALDVFMARVIECATTNNYTQSKIASGFGR